jgi:hypothetical protein
MIYSVKITKEMTAIAVMYPYLGRLHCNMVCLIRLMHVRDVQSKNTILHTILVFKVN